MKNIIITLFMACTINSIAQKPIKVGELNLKFIALEGWNSYINLEESNKKNNICNCSYIHFTKQHPNGELNIVVYPTNKQGLDSIKREMVGSLRFQPVEKYDNTKNEFFKFQKKTSYFVDTKNNNSKSYEVARHIAKYKNDFFIFYTWQKSSTILNPNVEKELNLQLNKIEPIE